MKFLIAALIVELLLLLWLVVLVTLNAITRIRWWFEDRSDARHGS